MPSSSWNTDSFLVILTCTLQQYLKLYNINSPMQQRLGRSIVVVQYCYCIRHGRRVCNYFNFVVSPPWASFKSICFSGIFKGPTHSSTGTPLNVCDSTTTNHLINSYHDGAFLLTGFLQGYSQDIIFSLGTSRIALFHACKESTCLPFVEGRCSSYWC